MEETVARLFENAIAASLNGNLQELNSFSEYVISDPSVRGSLIDLVKGCWRDPGKAVLFQRRSSGERSDGVSLTVDILATMLSMDGMWCDAITLWLSCLREGTISGQSTPLCVGVVCNKIISLSTLHLSDGHLKESIMFLQELPTNCFQTVFDGIEQLGQTDLALCFELVAPSVDALALLCKRKQAAAFRMINPVGHVLDAILDFQWGHFYATVIHLLCDVYPHLSSRHVRAVKEKVITAANNLSDEDYASVLLASIRQFELSFDVGWVTIIRILYKSVPENCAQTVEAIMEQSLSASSHHRSFRTCLRIVQSLEDNVAAWFKTNAFDRESSTENCGGGTIPEQKSLELMPACPSDIRLLLLLLRACRSGFGDSGSTSSCDTTENFAMSSFDVVSSNNADVVEYMVQISRTFCFIWLAYCHGTVRPYSGGDLIDVCTELLEHKMDEIVCSVLELDKCDAAANSKRAPPCSERDNGSSSSSSSSRRDTPSSNGAKKWTTVSRAADIYFVCNYAAHDISSTVAPCAQFIIDGQMEHIQRSKINGWKSAERMMNEVVSRSIESSAVVFLSECIAGCFAAVEESRVSIFTLIMRNIIDCGGIRDHMVPEKDDSNAEAVSVVPVNLKSVMKKCLAQICTRHGDLLTPLYSHFQSFLPMLAMLPVAELENVLVPFVHLVVSGSRSTWKYSDRQYADEHTRDLAYTVADLRGSMLMVCRKCAIQKEPLRSLLGIRYLVQLLPALPSAVQLEICESIVFPSGNASGNETVRIGASLGATGGNSLSTSHGVLPGHKFHQAIVNEVVDLIVMEYMCADPLQPLCPRGFEDREGLSPQCMLLIRDILMRKLLLKFIVTTDQGSTNVIRFFENDSLHFRDDFISRNNLACERNENCEKVYFSPASCCDKVKRSAEQDKGSSGCILTDDIYQQLRNCWTVDCLLFPNDVVEQLEWVCYRVLRGEAGKDDINVVFTSGADQTSLWSNIVFKGVINLIESGFHALNDGGVVLTSAEESKICHVTGDLSSKELVTCLYGAISALMNCLNSTLLLVPSHRATIEGMLAFSAAMTSLQTVLDLLSKMLEMGGDLLAFSSNAKTLLSKMGTLPSITSCQQRHELAYTNGTQADESCSLQDNGASASQLFTFAYSWGAYTIAINSFDDIIRSVKFQLGLFYNFVSCKRVTTVMYPLSIVLSALKMSCFEIARNLRRLGTAAKENKVSIEYLIPVLETLREVYRDVGSIRAEGSIVVHAKFIYGQLKTEEGCLGGYQTRRSAPRKGKLSNKRKRSIYAEYSDLSDFDDYVDVDKQHEGEDNGTDMNVEHSGANSSYEGIFIGIEKDKLLNSAESPQDLEFLDYGKDIMRLLSMCHSELKECLSSKAFNRVCILDLPECAESYDSTVRRGNDDDYTKMLRNAFFSLRYELLCALLAFFEYVTSFFKANMYSQLLRNDATIPGYLSYKRADIDDLIEELCSDLVIALREGTTFRLLKVNVDLLRVLIEIRNIRSGDLVAPTAFDSRIISANDDNMLHVLCACGLLVPRVVSQIAGLAIEKCLSPSESVDASLKLLLLCNNCTLRTDGNNGDLALRLNKNSPNIPAILLVALKSLQKTFTTCIDGRLDLRDNFRKENIHSGQTDTYEFGIYERFASVLFSPLQPAERCAELVAILFGAGTYELVECESIVSSERNESWHKNNNNADSSANNDLQSCMFNRFPSSIKRYYLGVVAKFFQACVQDCKTLLTALNHQNKSEKISKPNNSDMREYVVPVDLEFSFGGNVRGTGENEDGENNLQPEETPRDNLSKSKWPFLSSLLNLGRRPLVSDAEFSSDACVSILTKIKGTLQQNRISNTNHRHVVLVKAVDELELYLSFLGSAVRKNEAKKISSGGLDENMVRVSKAVTFVLNGLSKLSSIHYSKPDDVNGYESEASDESSTAKSTRKSKKVRRLRSRNTIVDDWLADEDGDDIYADLENFLVP